MNVSAVFSFALFCYAILSFDVIKTSAKQELGKQHQYSNAQNPPALKISDFLLTKSYY